MRSWKPHRAGSGRWSRYSIAARNRPVRPSSSMQPVRPWQGPYVTGHASSCSYHAADTREQNSASHARSYGGAPHVDQRHSPTVRAFVAPNPWEHAVRVVVDCGAPWGRVSAWSWRICVALSEIAWDVREKEGP